MKRTLPWILASLLLPAAGCGDGSHTEPRTRRYVFRAVGGASMGAITATQLGLRYSHMFDIIVPSGGGLDLSRMFSYFSEGMLGGFCQPPEVGRMCRAPEQDQDYEHMNCGGPNAGGFDRTSMIKAFQDMFIAYGNQALFNPEHPYLPPGVPASWLALSRAERCQNPITLPAFYDAEFNPEGKYSAITYCEADGPLRGVFDPSVPPNFPVEITVAIDLNGNGKRDSGEPVLLRTGERFDDVGVDGLADADEPGYDPVENPDPHGDDYDALKNPLGTERNGFYDEGEPYRDFGLDGVAGTRESIWDFGEGNGRYDFNPRVLRMAAMFDPSHLVKNLPREELDRLDFYVDVGIRDHLGFRWSSEGFVGLMGALGRPFDIRDGFEMLMTEDHRDLYDIHHIDWQNLGRDVFVRYGKPDATPAEIEAGDGGHVGTYDQVVYRFWSIVAYISHHWPDGDYENVEHLSRAKVLDLTYPSAILGEDRQFYLYLPPGYDERPEARYPVLYLMHGIGMEATDLTAAVLFTDPWMAEGTLQKFIIVFPDGRCKDDCFSGTFFANQMGRDKPPRRYEDSFFQELLPYIDANFRTRPPLEITLP